MRQTHSRKCLPHVLAGNGDMEKPPKGIFDVQEYRKRLSQALNGYKLLYGEITQKDLAAFVGQRIGKRGSISQSTASRWFGGSVPDLRTLLSIAVELEVDPGWLAFGDESRAPVPAHLMSAIALLEQSRDDRDELGGGGKPRTKPKRAKG